MLFVIKQLLGDVKSDFDIYSAKQSIIWYEEDVWW